MLQSMLKITATPRWTVPCTTSMREIGGNEHQLFGFFKCVMDHGVMVRTLEYSLPARLQQYELGEKIENYAAKHNRPMPWVV